MALRDPEVRKKCFEARDEYHQCYKRVGKEECSPLLQLYVQACPENWRQFWDQRFVEQLALLISEQSSLASKPHGIDMRPPNTENPYSS